MNLEIVLTNAQQKAADSLLRHLAVSPVAVLCGAGSAGKTAILKTVQATRGGVFLGARQFMNARQAQGPAAIEEAFFRMIEDAIESHDFVLVDDLSLVANVARGGGDGRVHLLDAALTAILAEARVLGRKLVFAVEDDIPWPIRRRAHIVHLADRQTL
jgi:transitional endoplasmic reticulum ATPase